MWPWSWARARLRKCGVQSRKCARENLLVGGLVVGLGLVRATLPFVRVRVISPLVTQLVDLESR